MLFSFSFIYKKPDLLKGDKIRGNFKENFS